MGPIGLVAKPNTHEPVPTKLTCEPDYRALDPYKPNSGPWSRGWPQPRKCRKSASMQRDEEHTISIGLNLKMNQRVTPH